MDYHKILQKVKILFAAVALMLAPVAGANAASWGPERPTYTNEKPAPSATFNSITNNAAVGNELAFVRIAERNSGNKLVNSLQLEAGKQYVVSIYYHNDASASTNILRDNAGNPILNSKGEEQMGPGVAMNVRVLSNFPEQLKAGETAEVTGKIISTNTTPEAVWAGADVTALQDMTIKYVENSARIYNNWGTNKMGISQYLFSDEGVFIGLNALNGMILGCDEYSGQVAYVLQTEAIANPDTPTPDPEPLPDPEPEPEPTPGPTPDPEPTPDPIPTPDDPTPVDPEVPSELPTTGPLEITLAVVVVVIIVAGVLYWRKTQKVVKKVTTRAKGKKK